MRALASILLALVTFACGSTSPSVRPTPEVSEAPEPARTEITVIQRYRRGDDRALVVATLDSGHAIALHGSRVLFEAGRVRRARDVLARDIVAAQRDAEGWVIVDAAGDLFRAADWLADLEPAGALNRGLRRSESRPVLAMIDRVDGGLWLGPDAEHVARVWAAGLHDASFVDAEHGWVLARGGLQFWTADRGASWSRLRTDGDMGLPADDGSGWWLWTDGQVRGHLGLSGEIDRERAPSGDPRAGRQASEAERANLLSQQAAVAPDLDAPHVGERWILSGHGGPRFASVDGAATSIETIPSMSACELHSLAGGVGAVCFEEEGSALYHSEDGVHYTARYSGELRLEQFDPAAFWAGSVSQDDEAPILEIVDVAGDVSRFALDGLRRATLSALGGGLAAGSGERAGRDRGDVVWWVDLRAGTTHMLDVPPDWHPRRLQITDSRDVLATMRRDRPSDAHDETRLYRVEHDELVQVPLPDGAVAVAFSDRMRGVAVGRHLGALWRTINGGTIWRPIEVAEGDLASIPLRHPEVACRGARCTLETDRLRVALSGRGELREPSVRFVQGSGTAPPPPPSPGDNLLSRELVRSFGSLECEWAGEPPPPEHAGSIARAELSPVRGGRWRVEWSGADERPYRLRSAPFELPESTVTSLNLQSVSRAGALLNVCFSRRHCAALTATPRAAPVLVDNTHRVGGSLLAAGARLEVDDLLFANRRQLRQSVTYTNAETSQVEELRFGTSTPMAAGIVDGHPIVAVPIAWPAHGGAPAGGTWQLVTLDGAGPRFQAQSEAFSLCTGPAGGPQLAVVDHGGESAEAATRYLELGPGGFCVRAIELRHHPRAADGSWAQALLRLEAADGRLRGSRTNGGPITCELVGAWFGGAPDEGDAW